MKVITGYELVNHGVHHEQYFQGCGTALTGYTEVETGIGNTGEEALEDAIEQLASSGEWDVESLPLNLKLDRPYPAVSEEQDSHHYYVSIRVR